jgi:uncharacterized membrane protein YidH (DUF202 family)
VRSLLDAAFGLFVWMAHLVAIYVAAALACGLGLVGTGARNPTTLASVLAATTVVGAGIVALHATRRWRQMRDFPERRFRMTVTVGADAIAIVAIMWQLIAIGLVPPCA